MTDLTASRTLVKSGPELWAECSDAASLTRHLGAFGEIRITRLEPETAVAWEGDAASGTVRLEPSGWGTRVVLTAAPVAEPSPAPVAEPEPMAEPEPVLEPEAVPEPEPVAEPEPIAAPEPVAEAEPEPEPALGAFGRLRAFFGRRRPPAPVDEPETIEPIVAAEMPETPGAPTPITDAPVTEAPRPKTPKAAGVDPAAVLDSALDSLGRAHHRPYSRS